MNSQSIERRSTARSTGAGYAVTSPASSAEPSVFVRPAPQPRGRSALPQIAPATVPIRRSSPSAARSMLPPPTPCVVAFENEVRRGHEILAFTCDGEQATLSVLFSLTTVKYLRDEARELGGKLLREHPTKECAPLVFDALVMLLRESAVSFSAVEERWQRLVVTDQNCSTYFHGNAMLIALGILDQKRISRSRCASENARIPDLQRLTAEEWERRGATQILHTQFWELANFHGRREVGMMRVQNKVGHAFKSARIILHRDGMVFNEIVCVTFGRVANSEHIVVDVTYRAVSQDREAYVTIAYSSLTQTFVPRFDAAAPGVTSRQWLSHFTELHCGFYSIGADLLLRREQDQVTFIGYSERFASP